MFRGGSCLSHKTVVCLFDEESSMALQDLLKNIGERSCVDQRSRQLALCSAVSRRVRLSGVLIGRLKLRVVNVSTQDLFHSNLYTVEKYAPSLYKILYILMNYYEKFYQCKSEHKPGTVPQLGTFNSRRIIFIDAGHQRRTTFYQNFDMKTTKFYKMYGIFLKKGVENF
jgi:hypothetical protein